MTAGAAVKSVTFPDTTRDATSLQDGGLLICAVACENGSIYIVDLAKFVHTVALCWIC
jgi:hypothetical protein